MLHLIPNVLYTRHIRWHCRPGQHINIVLDQEVGDNQRDVGERYPVAAWRYVVAHTNGKTWGRMISSLYLMPVSVPVTTTRAVLPRDEIPPHTMTLPPLKGRRWITQLSWKRSQTRRYTLERPSLLSRWNLRHAICQFHSIWAWHIKDVFQNNPDFLFYRHQHYACTHV